MKKSSKIICSVVIIVLIAVIVTISVLMILNKRKEYSADQCNNKIISLHWGEGFGDGSRNYDIEIYEDGKVNIIYGNKLAGERKKETYNVDKEVIDKLKDVINENAKKVTSEKTDIFDYGGTTILIYEDGKEIYSFKDSWDEAANENFHNIAKKVREVKTICEEN